MTSPVTTSALTTPAPGAGRPARPAGVLRLGTRRSVLARTQSGHVARALSERAAAAGRPVDVELVEITTEGDVTTSPLSSLGGTGVFVSALRRALLDGEVDLAVHSLKDLPTLPSPGVALAAVPQREDPRDVLVASGGRRLAELAPGARVGTGSPRRAAQLRLLGRGLDVVDLRGNVDTRIRRVGAGDLDAVVLARAGLARLGRLAEATEVLDTTVMLPAPGQGALAIECRADDAAVVDLLALLDDPATRAAVTAERRVLRVLEAGCAAPLAALATFPAPSTLRLEALVAAPDGSRRIARSAEVAIPPADGGSVPASGALSRRASELGESLARELLRAGAAELVDPGVRQPGHPTSPSIRDGNTTSPSIRDGNATSPSPRDGTPPPLTVHDQAREGDL